MRRTWKWAALVICGGVLVQVGGCWTVVADFALQALVSGLANQILTGFAGTATT